MVNWRKIMVCDKCKNRSKFKIELLKDDDGDFKWIMVRCKKCDSMLFYNGA